MTASKSRRDGKSRYNPTPFYLGIEGEKWDANVPGLVVPYPDGKRALIVIRGGDSYAVVTQGTWEAIDDLIMVAAYVHDRINSDGEET